MASSSSTSKHRLPDFLSMMEDMSKRGASVQEKMAVADVFKTGLMQGTHDNRMQFHEDLRVSIARHEDADTYGKAQTQGRLIWRSWGSDPRGAHELELERSTTTGGHVSPPHPEHGGKAEEKASTGDGARGDHTPLAPVSPTKTSTKADSGGYMYPLGMAALDFSRTSEAWKAHKAETRADTTKVVVPSYPSTVLRGDGRESQVWSERDGTVARLLPEGLNAGFHIFNEVAKATGKRLADSDPRVTKQNEKIATLGRELRATVTRPEFFLKSDLGTSCELRERSTGTGVHIKRTTGLPPKEKEKHPDEELKANAVFYQTHYATASPSSAKNDGHNEMTVKYRSTGAITSVPDHVPKGAARGMLTTKSLGLVLPNHGEPEGREALARLPDIPRPVVKGKHK